MMNPTNVLNSLQLDEYHLLLDSKADGTAAFTFRTLDEVVESGMLDKGTAAQPVKLYVAPGVYWIHNPDDDGEWLRAPLIGWSLPYEKTISFKWLHIIGLDEDPRRVVFAARKGQSFGCIGNYTMFHLLGEGLYLKNLTIGNYCNIDLEYPGDPSLNRKRRTDTITQAQLGDFNGQEMLAENCRFVSRLNLYPISGAMKCVYDRCHFESTDDALNGHAIYHDCDFDFYGGAPLGGTHRGGAVFLKCQFRVHSGKLSIVKVRGQMTAIGCNFAAKGTPVGGNANPEVWAYEYGNTWNGEPFTLNDINIHTVSLADKPLLESYYDKATDTFPLEKLLGNMTIVPEYPLWKKSDAAPAPILLKAELPEAPLTFDGEKVPVKTQLYTYFMEERPETAVSFRVPEQDAAYLLSVQDGVQSCLIENRNDSPRPIATEMTAYTESGLEAQIPVALIPKKKEPPKFEKIPEIVFAEDRFVLSYALSVASDLDNSHIIWYRQDPSGARLSIQESDGPDAAFYTPDEDDIGCILSAEIAPRSLASDCGDIGSAKLSAPVSAEQVKIRHRKYTDFSRLPLDNREGKGIFCTNVFTPRPEERGVEWGKHIGEIPPRPWIYGSLGAGCVGSGLYFRIQGSSVTYQPNHSGSKDMSVHLLLDPAKSGGQGFGSADQYMDLGIGFDWKNMTGPALRIKRTTKASDGVEVSLVHYENGITTQLTEPVIASCFLTGCDIHIDTVGGKLTASMKCSAEPLESQKEKGWLHQISLAAECESAGVDFCLVHTGTCGNRGWLNVVMLHELEILYK